MTITIEVSKFNSDEFIMAVNAVGLKYRFQDYPHIDIEQDHVAIEISAEGGFGTSENARKLWTLGTLHHQILVKNKEANLRAIAEKINSKHGT